MKKVKSVLLFLIIVSGVWAQEAISEIENPLVVFLVRHAEKVDDSRDPELSEEGKKRTENLAKTLQNSEIEYIHSSDFIRTRKTAELFALQLGIKVELYNPRNLLVLADKLKETGGRHLVVGHSNTTPELAKLLGGEPGSAIEEKSEYDRLYIVTISKDKSVSTVLLRYGKKYLK